MARLHGVTACFFVCFSVAGVAYAGSLPRNNLGGVGLIDMPSARMAPDGSLAIGGSYFQNNQHYNFTFQALPWLETSFRYSGLEHFDPSFPVYYDRSFAFKARLWDESGLMPAVAVGVNDLVGTGFFSGEYLVASKKFTEDFDVTAGIGWGRLATANTVRNPLALISNHFETRTGLSSTAGQVAISQYFRGHNAGLFGGVTWATPVDDLSLVLEYSSDGYSLESTRGNFSPRTQVNIGASYRAFDGLTLGVNYLYGRSLSVNAAFEINLTSDSFPARLVPPPSEPRIRTPEQQQAALGNLTGWKDGRLRVAAIAKTNRNALVDGLWGSASDISDAAIRGQTLVVTIVAGDAKRICASAASLAKQNGSDINAVTVLQAGTHAVQHCTVPMAARPMMINAVQPEDPPFLGIVARDVPLLTINAVAAPPVNRRQAIATIKAEAEKQKISITAISLSETEAVVYFINGTYFHQAEAVGRLVRILTAYAPTEIEKFRLVATSEDWPLREFDILRGPTERAILQNGSFSLFADGNSSDAAALSNPVLARSQRGSFPQFSGGVFPQFRQQLFDPSNPLAIQFLAGVYGTAQLAPGLTLNAEAEADIYDNFNVNRASDSVLPHVRSDFVKYFTQGKNGIGMLDTEYRFRLAPDVFVVGRAGYLESMFAGVGGEVLWRPEGQRWALGVDAYQLWQRNFDRLFGLQRYKPFTGHVALYYASPWYGLQFTARAGRYLAGDDGLTLEVTRRFETGVEIGAFFTKTNVSATRFGEGSFDKGIIIRIPLEFALPIATQNTFATVLRPVQRDGGQQLANDATLYEETRRSSYAEMETSGDIVVEQ